MGGAKNHLGRGGAKAVHSQEQSMREKKYKACQKFFYTAFVGLKRKKR
jgi:hypothetical protein